MKNKVSDICYFCGLKATSQEHVPPRAIFPEMKDVGGGYNYRESLLKVPSCELHNSAKSPDDEFLLYVLAMSLTSNEISKKQFHTKVMRAIARKPTLIDNLLMGHQPVTLHDMESDKWSESIALRIKSDRLNVLFGHIAKAIYFHEKKMVWQGGLHIMVEFLLSLTNAEHNLNRSNLGKSADEYMSHLPNKGAHPEVFAYQFAESGNEAILRLKFYGSSKVLVGFSS